MSAIVRGVRTRSIDCSVISKVVRERSTPAREDDTGFVKLRYTISVCLIVGTVGSVLANLFCLGCVSGPTDPDRNRIPQSVGLLMVEPITRYRID